MSEFVQIKLTNSDLLEKVKQYYSTLEKMREIANWYITDLKENGHGDFGAAILSNIDQTFIEFVGIRNSIVSDGDRKTNEIFHPNFNVSRDYRGQMYQPLKKNKFNKEKTNNFEDTKVNFAVLLEVIFNDPSPVEFVGKELRYKPLTTDYENGVFTAFIARRDINEHTLANFEVLNSEQS